MCVCVCVCISGCVCGCGCALINIRGPRTVMVTIIENGHDDSSSNPGRG